MKSLKKFSLKEGKKDFRPREFPTPIFRGFRRIIWHVEFSDSCWYDWRPDQDYLDWNKGGGITNFWSPNDVDTFQWAWRPKTEIPGVFDLTAYSNIGKHDRYIGHGDVEPMLSVMHGDSIRINCSLILISASLASAALTPTR